MDSIHRKATAELISRSRSGDAPAAAELFELTYEELRRIANAFFKREPPGHTLQPTAVVHELYLKLVDRSADGYRDRDHFLAVAARAMRFVLVSHTRRRNAQKRGRDAQRVALDDFVTQPALSGVDILDLHDGLERLAALDERKAQIVELRLFLSMTIAEIARVLDISEKTVEKDWAGARAWLRVRLGDAH